MIPSMLRSLRAWLDRWRSRRAFRRAFPGISLRKLHVNNPGLLWSVWLLTPREMRWQGEAWNHWDAEAKALRNFIERKASA